MSTRTELARISQGEIVRRAQAEVEARQAGELEQLRLARAEFRIAGTYNLAEYAAIRATGLNRLVSTSDPHLHAIHRSFEETAAIVAGSIIYRYGVER
jgi:hypothetical protein